MQTYRVMPHITGQITSCVGAADANIQLSVGFVGRDPGCAIGTLPSDRLSPDGKPTVTVVPAHNTVDVSVDPAIVALFSDRMIEATITTGYPSATFNVIGPGDAVVAGAVQFTELFGATAAIFRPSTPLAFGTTYTVVVNPSVFSLDGLSLASGIVARFTTAGAVPAPDTTAPVVTLSVEAPLMASSIGRGQTAAIVAETTDAGGVTRVDLLLDGELIDTKPAAARLRFMVDTGDLADGSSHQLLVRAFDLAGNIGIGTLPIQIAADQLPPVASIANAADVGRGHLLPVTVNATDDGRVASVELFLDGATARLAVGMVAPFQFTVDTTGLAPGLHALRAAVADGAGNVSEVAATFTVTNDTTAPQIVVFSPVANRFRAGQPIAVVATASDDVAVATVSYRLDDEPAPRGSGDGFTLNTAGLTIGTHTVTIVATDTSGNVATRVDRHRDRRHPGRQLSAANGARGTDRCRPAGRWRDHRRRQRRRGRGARQGVDRQPDAAG